MQLPIAASCAPRSTAAGSKDSVLGASSVPAGWLMQPPSHPAATSASARLRKCLVLICNLAGLASAATGSSSRTSAPIRLALCENIMSIDHALTLGAVSDMQCARGRRTILNKLVLLGAVWVAALSAAEHGWAQTDNYPMRPIRIISPFPPGGSVDLV